MAVQTKGESVKAALDALAVAAANAATVLRLVADEARRRNWRHSDGDAAKAARTLECLDAGIRDAEVLSERSRLNELDMRQAAEVRHRLAYAFGRAQGLVGANDANDLSRRVWTACGELDAAMTDFDAIVPR